MKEPLKNSLIQPPAETGEIVDLFSDAADALIDGDRDRANELIAKADQCWVRDYVERAWGKTTPEIHSWCCNDAYKKRNRVPKDQQDKKTPPAAMQLEMFKRDAWHCCYCGIPVIDGYDAFKKLKLHAKNLDAWYWGNKNIEQHPGVNLIRGTFDHVKPLSAGGLTNLENLVTACWLCNAAKWDALLEEAGLADPTNRKKRPPVERSDWNGLRQLLKL